MEMTMLNSAVLADIKCPVTSNALSDLLEDLKNVNCTCFLCKSNKHKAVHKECSVFEIGIQAKKSNISDKFSQVDKRNVRLNESTEINRSFSNEREEVCNSSSSASNASKAVLQKLILCPHCMKFFNYLHHEQCELISFTGDLDNKHSSCEGNRINQEIKPIMDKHSEDQKEYNAKVIFNETELSIDDYVNSLRYSLK